MWMGWARTFQRQGSFRRRSSGPAVRAVRAAAFAGILSGVVIAAISCGSDAGVAPGAPTQNRRVTSVKFDRAVDTVEIQHTSAVTAVFVDQNGAAYNPAPVAPATIAWSTADAAVATVSPTGVVTGIGVGTTLLKIMVSGLTSSLPIVVMPPMVATIVFPVTSFTMVEGDTLTLPTPRLTDRSGAVETGRTPVFTSGSPNLRVSATGVVTALTAGSGSITATVDTAHTVLNFTIQAASIAKVRLVPAILDMGTGHTIATQASALSPDGGLLRGRTYTYTVDNPSVASVSPAGVVRGIASGKANLTVTTGTVSTRVPISVATLATGGFTIDVRFVGNVSSAVQQAALQAAQRWETVISAPLIPYHIVTATGDCGSGIPGVDTTETSMMIVIRSDSIDGRLNTVGLGGPCVIRDDAPQLTALGTITVDSADVGSLAQQGLLVAMLTHEMGHVLGIGTLWSDGTVRDSATYFPNTASGLGGPDPEFIGSAARAASAQLAFTADSALGVPIENVGGTGTRDGHWRATVFGHELMTGTLHNGLNPLSLVTIEALADFGYTVVPEAADDLSALNAVNPSATVTPSLSINVPSGNVSPGLQIRETLLRPRFTVSRDGKLHRIRGSSGSNPAK